MFLFLFYLLLLLFLVLFYMEKRCSETKGHPLSQVNLTERLQLFRERFVGKSARDNPER